MQTTPADISPYNQAKEATMRAPDLDTIAKFRAHTAVIKGVNAENRTVTGYASKGTIDRYGEIILPSAYKRDLPRFLEERHLFAAGHKYVAEDGKCTIIGKIISANVDSEGLYMTARFDDDPLSESWWLKYKSGTLNAFSVGFIPREWKSESMTLAGETSPRQVRVYTEVELLEISAVPIPANRESIVQNSFTLARAADLLSRQASFEAYVRDGFQQILMLLGRGNESEYGETDDVIDDTPADSTLIENLRAILE